MTDGDGGGDSHGDDASAVGTRSKGSDSSGSARGWAPLLAPRTHPDGDVQVVGQPRVAARARTQTADRATAHADCRTRW